MAKTISASVGRMGGKNNPFDVATVQQLLNQVPSAKGGPLPLLDVDGLCGPKTINAIQQFQLNHFGWTGADGRVDPNGPTLNKLNEFDGIGNAQPNPIFSDTAMSCPHHGRVQASSLRGTPVLTTSDKFVIQGCVFLVSPCVRVQWIGRPGAPLNQNSIGTCLNNGGMPQGIVKFA